MNPIHQFLLVVFVFVCFLSVLFFSCLSPFLVLFSKPSVGHALSSKVYDSECNMEIKFLIFKSRPLQSTTLDFSFK